MNSLCDSLPPKVQSQLRELAVKRGIIPSLPLWPAPYSENNAESAWLFIRELRTWNEANGLTEHFPEKAYLQEIVKAWHDQKAKGKPLVLEKSRRLVASYLMCALELHSLGCKPGNGLIVHLTNEDAGREVWRIWQMYEDLRSRHPEWKLPKMESYGNELSKVLDVLMFPNGSTVKKSYQKPGALQGEGTTIIRIEEIGRFQHPSGIYAQALTLTEGKPGDIGGLVVAITNASPSEDWRKEVKHGFSAREVAGLTA